MSPCNSNLSALTALLPSVFGLGFSIARADTIYTYQASFLAATQPGYYLETFDSLNPGVVNSPQAFSMNGFSYTASSGGFYNLFHWVARDRSSGPDHRL